MGLSERPLINGRTESHHGHFSTLISIYMDFFPALTLLSLYHFKSLWLAARLSSNALIFDRH